MIVSFHVMIIVLTLHKDMKVWLVENNNKEHTHTNSSDPPECKQRLYIIVKSQNITVTSVSCIFVLHVLVITVQGKYMMSQPQFYLQGVSKCTTDSSSSPLLMGLSCFHFFTIEDCAAVNIGLRFTFFACRSNFLWLYVRSGIGGSHIRSV